MLVRSPTNVSRRAHGSGWSRALLLAAGILASAIGAPAANANGAAEGHYLFRTYGPEQGLPSVYILGLLQDRSGFIWVSTESGLYRYDGYRFDAFGLRDGLQSASIGTLYEDRAGTLWVATRAGLNRWNGKSFDAFGPEQGLPAVQILGVADGPDSLWTVIWQAPFMRASDGQFRPVPGWPGGNSTAVAGERGSRRMWVAQWDGKANILSWQDGVWQRHEGPAGDTDEPINRLVEDGQGRLWARHAGGLWVKRPGGEFEIAATPVPIESEAGFLIAGSHGDIWVPFQGGLLHHDQDRWEIIDVGKSLPVRWTRSVLEDREGSLWWGSVGLHRLLGRNVFRAYTSAEGLDNQVVWCIFRDRQQRLWVATGAGLSLLTEDGFRTIPGTEANDIRSIAQGADENLYLAGRPGNEILVYNPRTARLSRQAVDGVHHLTRILRLLVDRDGVVWAATSDGLYRADASAAQRHFVKVDLPGDNPAGIIFDVREDAQGRLWVAGQYGLSLLEKGIWHRFTTRDGLRRDSLAFVRPTESGDLLISYFDPLGVAQARYADGELHVIRHLDSASTGSADDVFIIGEDSKHRYWIGSSRGVDMVTPQYTRHFGLADGLVGEDTANMAFLAEDNGDIWIGTSTGLARFSGSIYDALPEPMPPSVALTELRLGAQTVLPQQRAMAVPHSANVFEGRLAGLSFLAGPDLQYRVRLAGLESDFHITDSRDARYPELPFGQYRFEASARIGPKGRWGPQAALEFEVLPAWWQSWWFRVLAALAAAAALAQTLRWRTHYLQRRNLALEAQIVERTGELRRANHELRSEIDQRVTAQRALAKLNVEERRRTERFSLVARIASIISSDLDCDTLLQRAADALHEVLDYPNVDIPLVDPANPEVLALRIRGGGYKARIDREDRLPIASGVMGAAVRARMTQRVDDTAADPRYLRPPTGGARAELAAPILLGNEVLGVINVEGEHAFDELDVASLEIIADYLAVAIANTRLFGQAQQAAILAERQRVAHDLHDNVTQILASISMLAQTLAHRRDASPDAMVRRAERLAELAQIAVAEMRAFLQQLRPPDSVDQPDVAPMPEAGREFLQGRSLPAAVQHLLRTVVPDAVQVKLDFDDYVPQVFAHEEALFRVCQEAVSNAIRHSGAVTLRVAGSVTDRHVCVGISDDGRGMPLDRGTHGIGQESMRSRISSFGGRLRVSAAEPRGTMVEAELPRADL